MELQAQGLKVYCVRIVICFKVMVQGFGFRVLVA